MQSLCPESGLRIGPNWSKIEKMTMKSQFYDMTLTSTFFDVFLFRFSSLVTGLSFISRLIRNPEIRNTLVLFLLNIWRLGRVMDKKFGTNVSNRMLLNAAKYQDYSFYPFWVIKGKSIEESNYPLPQPPSRSSSREVPRIYHV